MKRLFTRFRSKPILLEDIDLESIPILSSKQIIEILNLNNRLISIRRLTKTSIDQYDLLYFPAITAFIESCQLVPASSHHHHSGPGGLVIHTLEVIDRALRIRQQYSLPLNAAPETVSEQEHTWTYGIFIGALLHDAGKLITNYRLKLDTNKTWSPHGLPINESGANHYSIEFNHGSPYKLHNRLSNTFFYMIPAQGREWVSQNPALMSQISAWLYGEHYEHGVVGEIVRRADMDSVSSNLQRGGDRIRIPNAPGVPMVDRLLTTLRELIDTKHFQFNKSGATGWVYNGHTYMVCAVTVQAIVSHLNEHGATDIPRDNTRIFDILQEHGYVISNAEGGAIWHCTVEGSAGGKDYKHNLTMLKFDSARIFHPSRKPSEMTGRIIERAQSDIKEDDTKQINTTTGIEEHANSSNPEQTDKNTTQNTTSMAQNSPIESSITNDSNPVARTANSSKNEANDKPQALTSSPLDAPELAEHFLSWAKDCVSSQKMLVNMASAPIHITDEGVLFVTPKVFQQYVREKKLTNEETDEKGAVRRVQNKLQKHLKALGVHRKSAKHQNIHTYEIKHETKRNTIHGWLIPYYLIYGDTPPPKPNKLLKNASGFS